MLEHTIKQLNRNNIEDLMLLEKKCFSESLAEGKDSFFHAAEIYPKGSVLLYIKDKIAGALFFHPYFEGKVQKIKSTGITLTGEENCMYLHSFSIHPDFRGKGLTQILFDHFNNVSLEEGYKIQALMAVQGSEEFWVRYGFESVRQLVYGDALSTYMIRKTDRNL